MPDSGHGHPSRSSTKRPGRALGRCVAEDLGDVALEATNGTALGDLLARSAQFALLFVDLNMPVVSGDGMARRINRSHPDLRVRYVTGHSDWLMDGRALV